MKANAASNKTIIPPIIPPTAAPTLLLLAPDTAAGLLLAFATSPLTLDEVDVSWVEVMVTVTAVGVVVADVLVERGTEEELEDVVRDEEGSVAWLTIKKSRNNGSF